MEKDKILLVYTGGTIGGERDEKRHIIGDLEPKQFIQRIEKLFPEIKNEIDFDISTPIKRFSEDFDPLDWMRIAEDIQVSFSKSNYAGVVIAHGTDTMCYTAAALSFIDFGKNIPICLTGSNYPIMDEKSDAPRNFHDAIYVARQKKLAGTFLVFSGTNTGDSHIHLGNRVRKVQFADNCYQSINYPEIGSVQESGVFRSTKIKYKCDPGSIFKTNGKNKFSPKLDHKVILYKVYPGFNPSDIIYKIKNSQASGIILELYNSGTGCTTGPKYSLLPAIHVARENNVPVFATSQHTGSVKMDTYKTSIQLKEAGVIPLYDMISEAALTKLMIILGHTKKYEDVVDLMTSSIAGEISPINQ